jgi:hypothetical protein
VPDFKNTLTQNGIDVSLSNHTHVGLLSTVSTFPANPSVGDILFHSGLSRICECVAITGFRWASEMCDTSIPLWGGLPPYSSGGRIMLLNTGTAACVFAVYLMMYTGTPNNATNYWSIDYQVNSLSQSIITTATVNPNVAFGPTLYPTGNYASPAQMSLVLTKVGSPGSIPYMSASCSYRRLYP